MENDKSIHRVFELPLEFLRKITNDFSEERKVAECQFGTIFKGILTSGEEIAVKRLCVHFETTPGIFWNDNAGVVTEKEHKNIERTVGVCCEKKRKVVEDNGRYILTDMAEYLLCSEYVPRGTLDKYIFLRACDAESPDDYGDCDVEYYDHRGHTAKRGESCQLDWNMRFKIIMGICEGLHFLHRELKIAHSHLTPGNILLDENMVPKLANVGLPCFSEQNTPPGYSDDEIRVGQRYSRYMAPEIAVTNGCSVHSDIYSLGVIIMEIATGKHRSRNIRDKRPDNRRERDKTVNDELEKWMDEYIASNCPSLNANCTDQLKLCIRTGLSCTENDPQRRPSIRRIIEKLKRHSIFNEDIISSSTTSQSTLIPSISRELSSYEKPAIQSAAEPGVDPILLLSVQPRRLYFPLGQRLTSCLLYLTNDTNENIAFRLLMKTPRRFYTMLPLCGVVPPCCTYTLTVTLLEHRRPLPLSSREFVTLQSSVVSEQDLNNADQVNIAAFFEKAKGCFKKKGRDEEMTLAVVCEPPEDAAFYQLTRLAEILASQKTQPVLSVDVHPSSQNYQQVLSVEVHPNNPLILTSNQKGTICIWDYQRQATVDSFKVHTEKPVYSAKFIERKKWVVTGDGDGYIHVYSYATMKVVRNFEAHEKHIVSLAVNPTYPFVLSASDDHLIKLWDWNKDWECLRTFEGHTNKVTHLMFHPKDNINFASASLDRRVKIWNVFSGTCNITLDEDPDGLLCLHYLTNKQPRYSQQLLISGSSNGSAKVWNPDTQNSVSMLEGHADRLTAICWHPELDVLITGSLDGTIRIWKPTENTYRLDNIIGLNLGAVYALGYIVESRRIVAGCDQGIAMVKIN